MPGTASGLPGFYLAIVELRRIRLYINNWFSNMLRMEIPLRFPYAEFWAVENFYQAMKTTDIKTRIHISKLTPHQSKRYGRKVELRPDWDDIKLQVMEFGLRRKFSPGTKALQNLQNTKGEIVEWNNWGDTYWGAIATLTTDGTIIPVEPRKGLNNLGKLLMKIRDEQ